MASKYEHLHYRDENDNQYKLVYEPYIPNKGYKACHGCAFQIGDSSKCYSPKTCTPTDDKRNRLLKSGYLWKLVK